MDPITVRREDITQVGIFKIPAGEDTRCKICKHHRASFVRYFSWRLTMLVGDNLRVPSCWDCGKDTDLLMDFVIYHFIQRANKDIFRDIY